MWNQVRPNPAYTLMQSNQWLQGLLSSKGILPRCTTGEGSSIKSTCVLPVFVFHWTDTSECSSCWFEQIICADYLISGWFDSICSYPNIFFIVVYKTSVHIKARARYLFPITLYGSNCWIILLSCSVHQHHWNHFMNILSMYSAIAIEPLFVSYFRNIALCWYK